MEEFPGDPYEKKDQLTITFELLNSDDQKIITLVCAAEEILDPYDYAQALRAFADRIEALSTLHEADMGCVN